MPAKFKPCPFCATTGSAIIHIADMGNHWVKCTFCNATIGTYSSEEEAIAKWNKRAYINEENFNDLTTQQGSEPSEIAALVNKHFWIFDDLIPKQNKDEFAKRLRQLLPC